MQKVGQTSSLVLAGTILLVTFFWLQGSYELIFGPLMERYTPRYIKWALTFIRPSIVALAIVSFVVPILSASMKREIKVPVSPVTSALVIALIAHAVVVWAFRDHGYFGVVGEP